MSLSVPETLDFPACLVMVALGDALGSEHHHNGNSVNSENDLKRFLHCVSWFPLLSLMRLGAQDKSLLPAMVSASYWGGDRPHLKAPATHPLGPVMETFLNLAQI